MPTYIYRRLNIDTLADQLTPTALRTTVFGQLRYALLLPVADLAYDHWLYRRDKRFRMSYNGQVRLLENVVNQLMVGGYNMAAPAIYLSEPEPVEEFIIAPDGNWQLQNSIHYDQNEKDYWDMQQHDPVEPPEASLIIDGPKKCFFFLPHEGNREITVGNEQRIGLTHTMADKGDTLGVLKAVVRKDGEAYQKGIRSGDYLISVNGIPITDYCSYINLKIDPDNVHYVYRTPKGENKEVDW